MAKRKKVVAANATLVRCMGGRFCQHAHGTCTATAVYEGVRD